MVRIIVGLGLRVELRIAVRVNVGEKIWGWGQD